MFFGHHFVILTGMEKCFQFPFIKTAWLKQFQKQDCVLTRMDYNPDFSIVFVKSKCQMSKADPNAPGRTGTGCGYYKDEKEGDMCIAYGFSGVDANSGGYTDLKCMWQLDILCYIHPKNYENSPFADEVWTAPDDYTYDDENENEVDGFYFTQTIRINDPHQGKIRYDYKRHVYPCDQPPTKYELSKIWGCEWW